jgi:membrane associated rhomboid family serine protease
MGWHSTWNEPPPRRGFWQDRGGLLTPGVKLVLILTVAAFGLEMFFAGPMVRWGAVTARDLCRVQVWRLVTYMFLHGSTNHILINMFMLWMIGIALEPQLGTRRFLALYFTAGVVGGVCEAVFNCLMFLMYGAGAFLAAPAIGASAGVMGILVAFATLHPRAKFLFLFFLPVDAWWMALVYGLVETYPIVVEFLRGPGRGWADDNVAHAAHVGGMVLGFLWIRWGDRVSLWWQSRATRVQEPYFGLDQADEQELDRILDKVHRQGLDSLSTGEKMFLQEMSKRRGDTE